METSRVIVILHQLGYQDNLQQQELVLLHIHKEGCLEVLDSLVMERHVSQLDFLAVELDPDTQVIKVGCLLRTRHLVVDILIHKVQDTLPLHRIQQLAVHLHHIHHLGLDTNNIMVPAVVKTWAGHIQTTITTKDKVIHHHTRNMEDHQELTILKAMDRKCLAISEIPMEKEDLAA